MSTFITESNTNNTPNNPNINNNLDPEFPYMVPSRQCEPIIQCAILNFHDKTIPNPLSSKLSLQEQDQTSDLIKSLKQVAQVHIMRMDLGPKYMVSTTKITHMLMRF